MVIKISKAKALSARETEVLRWLCSGKSNWEISRILDLSPNTVKNHVSHILRKLEVTNRQQAVIKGVASGMAIHS